MKLPGHRLQVDWVELWVLYSVWAVASGWVLSLFHALTGPGYLVAGGAGLFIGRAYVLYFGQHSELHRPAVPWNSLWRRWHRRFRRGLPLGYLTLVVLAVVGGLLHPPSTYDALAYRIPRMLHWLAEGRWHWIQTVDARQNYSGTGAEWVQLPWLLLCRTERWLFLFNLLSYGLLPGLLFSVLRRLRVSPRVAWFWMWGLPAGYCFALQAASLCNDAFAAPYALAAVHYALRARETRRLRDFFLSLASAALLTGVKMSNLPLLLPGVVALWPVRGLAGRRAAATCAAGAVALLVSAAPLALLNHRYTGHWTGDPDNTSQMRLGNPLAGLAGNMIHLAVQGTSPPILPLARRFEGWAWRRFPRLLGTLQREFPRLTLRLGELPQEETSGPGLCLAMLMLASAAALLAALCTKAGRQELRPRLRLPAMRIGVAAWVALLVFMARLGSDATGRLLTPYYPLLVLPVLLPATLQRWLRLKIWHGCAALTMGSALVAAVLTPARPLWPAQAVLARATARWPGNAQLARAKLVYAVYATRHDLLAPLRKHLPPEATVIGLCCTANDAVTSLWRPYGRRRIRTVAWSELTSHAVPDLRWAVLKVSALASTEQAVLDRQLAASGWTVAAATDIISTVSAGPERWLVLQRR